MAIAQWTLAQVIAQLNSGRKWTGSTITYSFPTSVSGLYADEEGPGFRPTNGSQQTLMRLALNTWDDLIPANFQLGSAGSTALEFGYTSTGIGFAHAYYPTNGSIWFNAGESDLTDPVLGAYGFMTFVHEIGHALGLDHMGNYNGNGNWSPSSYQDSIVLSVMSYFGPRYAASQYSPDIAQADWGDNRNQVHDPQTPMVNDVAAIQQMYGTPTDTRAGNTTYGFRSNVDGAMAQIFDFARNANPILTIYDSAGTDTLDLSGWSTPSRIDLTPGAYSSGNSMTNNIGIAYSAWIENAIGGSANDVLIGNSLANRLEGGAGDDELEGREGDDVLVPGSGSDRVDGGDGTDTLVLSLAQSAYSFSLSGSLLTLSSGALVVRSSSVERFQFLDVTRTLSELVGGGGNPQPSAPVLLSRTPADDSANVPIGANLVLSFSETVLAGSGTIRLLGGDGSVLREVAANDSRQVQISGSTVTLNLETDLAASMQYIVNIGATAFRNAAGVYYAGLAGLSDWDFRTVTATVQDDYPLDVSTTGRIVPGAPGVTANIDSGTDGDLFRVDLSSGVTYRFDMTAPATSAVDPYLMLYGMQPEVDLITFDDDSGGNFNSVIYFTPTQSGTYFLAAYDYADAQGSYTLTASVPSDDYLGSGATLGRVAVGDVVGGRIGAPSDADNFFISLQAGQTYTFELNRTAGDGLDDPYLTLLDTNGHALAFDDDSGIGGNALIVFKAPSTGNYQLSASDFDQGSGNYRIVAQLNTRFTGTAGNDNFAGGSGPDTLDGGDGNDTLRGSGGADLLDGGAGIDTAKYSGSAELFEIFITDQGWLLRDTTNAEGSDTLVNIERLAFPDAHVALDLDGNAGITALILGAVFGAEAVYEPEYVGIGLSLLDSGMSDDALMQLAIEARFGRAPSNNELVDLLYFNLLGVHPGQDELNYFAGLIKPGFSQVDLAWLAATQDINFENIDFVGLAQYGLFFEPVGP
ncbi:M10 family metallopeptidase C-terminal domain-containing protein [Inhella sp.]|uniref:M10 family metallopeptidase C-terminal domain-containing protein n=1 Tax=Inhella sp. TaxID=1921806 RepID=UPI0035AF17DA